MSYQEGIRFCHIIPTAFLPRFAGKYLSQLLLAHLVESDKIYTEFYRKYEGLKILDNSAFEMYKENKPMYSSDKLIQMGRKVNADYIVMSDYPDQDPSVTIKAAEELAPKFKEKSFGTFFCPQSKVGDLEGLISSFAWAAQSPLVDYIGFSILNIPNAYGVEQKNKLQRYLSRLKFVMELDKRGVLDQIVNNRKKIHFLGMVDGPNEIELMDYNGYAECIDTWDSSAAVWYGLNGIQFDNSPTGSINGKFEKEVDFDCKQGDVNIAEYNLKYIDKLCGGEIAKEHRIND
jgi:hypothetical protein